MHPQGIRRLGRRHVACGPCSLLPTCSSFSYPLGTLAGQTLPTDEYDASYRSAAHALSTGELCRTLLLRASVNRFSAGTLLVLLLRGGPTGPTVPCTRVLAAGAGGTSQYRGRGEGCYRLRLRRWGL